MHDESPKLIQVIESRLNMLVKYFYRKYLKLSYVFLNIPIHPSTRHSNNTCKCRNDKWQPQITVNSEIMTHDTTCATNIWRITVWHWQSWFEYQTWKLCVIPGAFITLPIIWGCYPRQSASVFSACRSTYRATYSTQKKKYIYSLFKYIIPISASSDWHTASSSSVSHSMLPFFSSYNMIIGCYPWGKVKIWFLFCRPTSPNSYWIFFLQIDTKNCLGEKSIPLTPNASHL